MFWIFNFIVVLNVGMITYMQLSAMDVENIDIRQKRARIIM